MACILAALMVAVNWPQDALGIELEESVTERASFGDAADTEPAAFTTVSSRSKRRKRPLSKIPSPARRPPTAFETLLAGTLGGISGVVVSYPLDTLRIRMQTSGNQARSARVFLDLLRESGLSGMYRGVLSPVMGAALTKGAVFGGYGFFQGLLRRLLAKEGQELTMGALCAAALGSGLVASLIVTPVERIKVVMQAVPFQTPGCNPLAGFFARSSMRGGWRGSRGYANVWGCARGLVADQGVWRGLYAGLGPTVMRVAPGYASYFATYEGIKRFLLWRERQNGSDVPPSAVVVMLKTAASGAVAGIMAWLPVYPFDVVKSRMQTDVVGGGPGMFEIASTLYNDGGYRPFFQGLTATLWRAIVNHAATFVVYEAAMGFLMKGGGSGGGTDEEDRENESE